MFNLRPDYEMQFSYDEDISETKSALLEKFQADGRLSPV